MTTVRVVRNVRLRCPQCSAEVIAEVIGEHETEFRDEEADVTLTGTRYSFALCPHGHVLLSSEEWRGEDDFGLAIWTPIRREWPEPDRVSNELIPEIVRDSLDEANKCHRAGAHKSCAIMCGHVLEGIGAHFETKGTLNEKLQQLRTKQVIDERLFTWGDLLRLERNAAIHEPGVKVSKENSTDLLDFANAICEYVFVLSSKFDAFKKRNGGS